MNVIECNSYTFAEVCADLIKRVSGLNCQLIALGAYGYLNSLTNMKGESANRSILLNGLCYI